MSTRSVSRLSGAKRFFRRFFMDWRLVTLLCVFTVAGVYVDARYGSQARTIVLGVGMGVLGTLMRSSR